QSPLTRVVAYVWHPLPIWEIANSGHVDALMVALMLLGLWVALSGHTIRGAVLLALSTLAKSLAAPALAVIWRPWNWKMALAVLATIALCYAPYLSVGAKVSGFLTGYLNEEGLLSGDSLWLLSVWRLIVGPHQGDVAIYFGLAGFLIVMLLLWVWRSPLRAPAFELADINMLLLAVLLLLSPNYPWYFLVIAPFVALLGNPPTWAASIGALLLTDEVHWVFLIPPMIAKSILLAPSCWLISGRRGLHTRKLGKNSTLNELSQQPNNARCPRRSPPLSRGSSRQARCTRRSTAGLRLSGSNQPMQSAVHHVPAHLCGARAAGRHELGPVYLDRRSAAQTGAGGAARGRRAHAGREPSAHGAIFEGARRLRIVQYERYGAQ